MTMLIVFGYAIGPASLDLLPGRVEAWFEPVTRVALVMIGFLLGERRGSVHRHTARHRRHRRRPGLLLFSLALAMVVGLEALGGARLADAPALRRWLGVALLPQAGVALGMALAARERLPEGGDLLLSPVIAATVVFEVFGPFCTRLALERAGECGRRPGAG